MGQSICQSTEPIVYRASFSPLFFADLPNDTRILTFFYTANTKHSLSLVFSMHIIVLDNELCIFKEMNLPPSTTIEQLRLVLIQDGLFHEKFQFLSIDGEELLKHNFSRSIGSFISIMSSVDCPLVITVHRRSITTDNSLILSHNYALHMKKCMTIMEKTIAIMKAASDGYLVECKKQEQDGHGTTFQMVDESQMSKNCVIPSNIDLDDLTMAEFSLQPGNFDEGTHFDNDTVTTSLSQMFNDRNHNQSSYFQSKYSSLDLEQELTNTDRLRLLSFDGNHEIPDAEPVHQKWFSRKLNKTKTSLVRFMRRYQKINDRKRRRRA